jgi:nitrogen fixation/metabolism regulation signal transduction histidine kinase
MRINIAVKLFLGFLAIVLLNMFYVVTVLKFSDLNSMVYILKKQDWVQQGFQRLSKLHGDRERGRVIFANLANPLSAQKFAETSAELTGLLDSLVVELDSVELLDSVISREKTSDAALVSLVQMVKSHVVKHNLQYTSGFAELAALTPSQSSVLDKRRTSTLSANIDEADSSFLSDLASVNEQIDTQTRRRIKEIENRTTSAKQVTTFILIGVSVFAAAFALVFSSAISRRLRKLRDSAAYIGKGNFYFDPSGYSRDEIGDLATAFFDMALNLKKSQEELVKSKRLAAIGEIVASVNHEINNPLMIISGNAQFLEMSMQEYPEDIKERVRTIQSETERISQVTRKLREIKNPVVENYTSSGEQMINLDKSSRES